MPVAPTTPHQAIVLAAGEGRRLRPLTERIPKALVPFHGRPLLDHAVAHLARAGVTRVAVNAHHLADAIAAHVEGPLREAFPSIAFFVSREDALLGTGGAIKQLDPWLDDGPFWVANADVVYAEPLAALAARHRDAGAAATLLVTRDPRHRELRRLLIDDAGALVGLHEPWHPDGVVFCGVQLAERGLVDRLADGPSCNLRQGHLPYLASGLRVATWETKRFWADTGTPERLAAALGDPDARSPEVLATSRRT